MRFKDKVVLVTGSSRGIGKATVLAFAQEGANIVINHSKSEKEAEEVRKQVEELGVKVLVVKCDVSQEDQVEKMVAEVVKEFDRIDILVNNAGIVYDVPFFEKTTQEWKHTLDINLYGTVFCSKHVAKIMKEKETKGSIINISSINGITCYFPDSIDYDISKAGVNMFTQNFALEVAPLIRVNAVAPGWVNTEMNKELGKEFIEKETQNVHLKRFAEPEEIASVVVFLASEDASYINGEVIKVDGGYGGWKE